MLQYMNQGLLSLKPSGIRHFTALAKATPGCTLLTIGEPDFQTPEPIKQAAKDALDNNLTHYPPNMGLLALRQDVAQFENEAYGYDYQPDEIIMTVGATEAIFIAMQGVLNPGDEVIIPTPAFSLYESIARLAGAVPVALNTAPTGFQIDPDALRRLINDKTRLLILNSPNNPTGCVYTDETLRGIHDVVAGRPIFVLCDDVYRQLCYQPMRSFAQFRDLRRQLLVVQSFSKPYAMTGWRLGYLMGDRPVMEKLALYHASAVVSIAAYAQPACQAALKTDVSQMIETYRQRRDYVYRRITDMGLQAERPEGAFYIFPKVAQFGDTDAFCRQMVAEGKVAGVPGGCFGAEGYVRFSFCYSQEELEQGMDKLEQFLQNR